jgi:hypothetical protein
VKEVKLNQNYPIEGYQTTIFRADGSAEDLVESAWHALRERLGGRRG